ncbi:MAG: phosphate/phosphite/phosphonate ABC transporter substrate-binding protein [Candidatus Electrothrix scaldis]|nr:MAG: phosphate/phosphite/phosphonate ABC transporter substrate-binding protein [Candidatus Electrothrix sp. GW3-3]
MKRHQMLWGLLWLFFLLIDFGLAQAKEAKKEALIIGTAPYYYRDKLRQGFMPLIQYLSDELGRDVELVITRSYEELVNKMKDESFDVGFLSSVLYVQLKRESPKLKYLATAQFTEEGKNTSYYFSWIIARKSSEIRKVKHLRGKSFAFTNKLSSSGYVYPKGYFNWSNFIIEDFFSRIVFAGTHERVTDMVAEGEVETGVSYDANIWSAEERYGRVFRRIKRIGPILNPSFVANRQVDGALCQQLATALENMPPEVQSKDLVYAGFRHLSESNFTIVEDFLKTVDAPNGTKNKKGKMSKRKKSE